MIKNSCRICLSPYRKEIDHLLMGRHSYMEVATKFQKEFKAPASLLYQSIRNHYTRKHSPPNEIVIPAYGVNGNKIELFAQHMLEFGEKMIKDEPERVEMRDVISAQKLTLEKARLKLDQAGMMIEMAKVFGGFSKPEPIEGEEVENDSNSPGNTG